MFYYENFVFVKESKRHILHPDTDLDDIENCTILNPSICLKVKDKILEQNSGMYPYLKVQAALESLKNIKLPYALKLPEFKSKFSNECNPWNKEKCEGTIEELKVYSDDISKEMTTTRR